MNKKNIIIVLVVLSALKIFTQAANQDYSIQIDELKNKLVDNKVNEKWFLDAINDPKFELYPKMSDYFKNMAENKVDNNEKDFEWYKIHFGLDGLVKNGLKFIEQNIDILKKIESKNGIHYEIIVAILALETNFANKKHIGNFYVFNTLVSQYILMPHRDSYVIRELTCLYNFCQKTGKDTYFFIGSFAGASGWGQFLPSSLMSFFIDANNNDKDIDIFALDDNLYSIENYLFMHNLCGRNINDKEALYNAIYDYNPSDAYTKAIIYMYENMKQNRK